MFFRHGFGGSETKSSRVWCLGRGMGGWREERAKGKLCQSEWAGVREWRGRVSVKYDWRLWHFGGLKRGGLGRWSVQTSIFVWRLGIWGGPLVDFRNLLINKQSQKEQAIRIANRENYIWKPLSFFKPRPDGLTGIGKPLMMVIMLMFWWRLVMFWLCVGNMLVMMLLCVGNVLVVFS